VDPDAGEDEGDAANAPITRTADRDAVLRSTTSASVATSVTGSRSIRCTSCGSARRASGGVDVRTARAQEYADDVAMST
jgi:hypothetical protein